MSNYTKLTDYASKDALSSGNPSKLIKGTEIDADFLSIQNNMATKIDLTTAASPTVVTSLADADQFRIWQNSGLAEKQITADNVYKYLQARMPQTPVSVSGGTSKDFLSVPSWVTKITIPFAAVSTNGTGNLMFQLGTGGVPTTTGIYQYSEGRVTNTPTAGWIGNSGTANGFQMWFSAAVRNNCGIITFMNLTGNTWVASWIQFNDALANTGNTGYGTGNVTLAGALDMVRFTSTTPDTFDAGTARIFYE